MNEQERLDNEVRRGQYATELLNNPVFQEIWTQFRQAIVTELEISSPRDADGREKAVMMLQLLRKLQAMVQETADTGKMAQMSLMRRGPLQKARDWISKDGLAA